MRTNGFWLLLALLSLAIHAGAQTPGLTLWYRQPATGAETLPYANGGTTKPGDNSKRKGWVEALPVGNGRLGAMVFGGIRQERIQLNEETLWAGHPREVNNPKALDGLRRVRELLFDGQEDAALDLGRQTMVGTPKDFGSYQSMGDLVLSFPTLRDSATTAYRRELSLENAIASVRFRQGDGQFQREVFASHPDRVIVVRLTASGPDGLTIVLSLHREKDARSFVEAGALVLRGQVRSPDETGTNRGLVFETRVLPRLEGGTLTEEGDRLVVRNARALTLLIAGATSHWGENPTTVCRRTLEGVARKPYAALKARHAADFSALFNRLRLQINAPAADEGERMPTDERVEKARQDSLGDDFLSVLQYQYARYLMISCSRPGDLPANLQGLWNEHLHAPWQSDYHTNINLQMNYWFVEAANLPECHQPIVDFLDFLIPHGQKTARAHYGARGWVVHHATDAFGYTAPVHDIVGVWPVGGAWLSRHAYEHYLFSQDVAFLRQKAYPQIKGAAEFMLDFLVEIPQGKGLPFEGKLVTNPSHSPENAYEKPDGTQSMFGVGATMDLQIIRDLFDNCLEALDVLRRATPSFDEDFRQRLLTARGRLVPVQISPSGRIQEWILDYKEPELGHRHLSHLYSLYPDNLISLEKTPDLAQAALKTLEVRLRGNANQPKFRYGSFDPYLNGKGGTGWGRVWISLCYARLGMGNEAHRHHAYLQSRFLLPNLFGLAHGVYQIDNVFGNAATTAEMLLQSHDGAIHLLPALPDKWARGAVRGMRAVGGFEVAMNWENGRLVAGEVLSRRGGPCAIRSKTPVRVVRNGKTIATSNATGATSLVTFATRPNETYQLQRF